MGSSLYLPDCRYWQNLPLSSVETMTGSAEGLLESNGMKMTWRALDPMGKSFNSIFPQTLYDEATISGRDGVVGLIRTFRRSKPI